MAEPKRRKSQLRNYAETALGTAPEAHAKRRLIAREFLGGDRSAEEGMDIQESVRRSLPESNIGSHEDEIPEFAHTTDARASKRAMRNMSPSQVKSLQIALKIAGYGDKDFPVDGKIGTRTRAAISKALQATDGLDNLTPKTEVKAIQAALRASGATDARGRAIKVDGIVGPRTREAMRKVSSRLPRARPEEGEAPAPAAAPVALKEDRATRERRTPPQKDDRLTTAPDPLDLKTPLESGGTQGPVFAGGAAGAAATIEPQAGSATGEITPKKVQLGPGEAVASNAPTPGATGTISARDPVSYDPLTSISGGAPTTAPTPSGAGQMASTMVPWSPGAAEEHAFRRDRNAAFDLGGIALHSPTAPPYTSRANLPLPDAKQFQTDAGGGPKIPGLFDSSLADAPSPGFTTDRPGNIPPSSFAEQPAFGENRTRQILNQRNAPAVAAEMEQLTRGAPEASAPGLNEDRTTREKQLGVGLDVGTATSPTMNTVVNRVREAIQNHGHVTPEDAAAIGRDYINRNPQDAEAVLQKFQEKKIDITEGAPDWTPGAPSVAPPPSGGMLTPEERAIPFGPDAPQSTIGSFSPPPEIAPPARGYPAVPEQAKDYINPGVFSFDPGESAYTAGGGGMLTPPNITGPDTYADDSGLMTPRERLGEHIGANSNHPWTHAVTPEDFEHSLDLDRYNTPGLRNFDQAPNPPLSTAGFLSPPQVQHSVPGQAPVDPRSLDLRNEGLGSKAFVDPNRSLGLSLGPNPDQPSNPNLPGDLNGLYQNGFGYAPDPNAPAALPGGSSSTSWADPTDRLGGLTSAVPKDAFRDLLASAPSVNTALAPTSQGTQVARSFVKPGESLIREDLKANPDLTPSPVQAPAPTFAPTDSLDHTLLTGAAPNLIREIAVNPAKIPDKLPSFIFDQPDLNAGFLAPSTAPAPVVPANTPEEAAKAAIIGLNPPTETAPDVPAPAGHTRGFTLKKPGDEAPAVMPTVTPVPEEAPDIIAAAAPEENLLQKGLEAAAHPVATAKAAGRKLSKAPEVSMQKLADALTPDNFGKFVENSSARVINGVKNLISPTKWATMANRYASPLGFGGMAASFKGPGPFGGSFNPGGFGYANQPWGGRGYLGSGTGYGSGGPGDYRAATTPGSSSYSRATELTDRTGNAG